MALAGPKQVAPLYKIHVPAGNAFSNGLMFLARLQTQSFLSLSLSFSKEYNLVQII